MPVTVSPDYILEASRAARILKVDANVIAYFGDYFHAVREGLKTTVTPVKSVRKVRVNTASAQNPS